MGAIIFPNIFEWESWTEEFSHVRPVNLIILATAYLNTCLLQTTLLFVQISGSGRNVEKNATCTKGSAFLKRDGAFHTNITCIV